MSENFLNLKRRVLLGIILKALILGISACLIAISCVVLVQKLTIGEINVLICALAGVASFVVLGGLLILISFPTEKRIARLIDNRLSLNEKVQTMVSFKEENGTIVGMQRENTDKLLGEVKAKQLINKKIWLNIIAPIVAIALIITAILVPAKTIIEDPGNEDTGPIDPDFDATKIQIQELEDLIEYVKDSNMEIEPRALLVEQLEGLLTFLKSDDDLKLSVVKEKVFGVITETNKILDNANSADDISYELNGSENEKLVGLANSIKILNSTAIGIDLSAIQGTLPDTITKVELKSLCEVYATLIKNALVASEIPTQDILLVSLLQLANKLSDISQRVETTTMVDIQRELTIAFENAKIDTRTAISIQLNNSEVAETVIDELVDIFGLSLSEIPTYDDEDYFESVENPSDNTPPEQGSGGGLGGGEMLYGSNDKIYDPETGNFVEYGTLIDKYLAVVTEQVQDGKVPESLEDFINNYFATLYGGGSKTE